MTGAATAEEDAGDFFKIRREQLEKRKKIAKKRNETFLKVGIITHGNIIVKIYIFFFKL